MWENGPKRGEPDVLPTTEGMADRVTPPNAPPTWDAYAAWTTSRYESWAAFSKPKATATACS